MVGTAPKSDPAVPPRPPASTGAGASSFDSSSAGTNGGGLSSPSPDAVSLIRQRLTRAGDSYTSVPPDGAILTGKQEHCIVHARPPHATHILIIGGTDLKRELLSQQTRWEITELASPTALQRFGAPFRSDVGEVAPQDSELPLLRYIFVNHVRNFPFLDQAKEKEFWQDKLQLVGCWYCFGMTSADVGSSWSRLRPRTFLARKTAPRTRSGRSWLSRRRSWSS
jgi:hypothetical protein